MDQFAQYEGENEEISPAARQLLMDLVDHVRSTDHGPVANPTFSYDTRTDAIMCETCGQTVERHRLLSSAD